VSGWRDRVISSGLAVECLECGGLLPHDAEAMQRHAAWHRRLLLEAEPARDAVPAPDAGRC
jgi:hypothetical protein